MSARVRTRQAPALRVGERVRYLDGSEWKVDRVSVGLGSARVRCYLGSGRAVEREVEFRDGRTARFHSTTGRRTGEVETISARAMLERVSA